MDNRAPAFLIRQLLGRQLPEGGWGYQPDSQASTEATCLALSALPEEKSRAISRGVRFLRGSQNPDGSWPAFGGDDSDGCWVTALAVIALSALNEAPRERTRAAEWLLDFKGREGHWFWRWKFRLFDTKVSFNPDKFGWPWFRGTVSWVIPTAFALIALRKIYPKPRPRAVSSRLKLGIEMLWDRMCPGGGWNAGNGVVFGVPLDPHVDATAIALLALRGEPGERELRPSTQWLKTAVSHCFSVHSLAWAALAIPDERSDWMNRLRCVVSASYDRLDSATLALACLALQPNAAVNVFAVPGHEL
jgi:hypothetical protein